MLTRVNHKVKSVVPQVGRVWRHYKTTRARAHAASATHCTMWTSFPNLATFDHTFSSSSRLRQPSGSEHQHIRARAAKTK
ncbi:AB hydrolase-1 domain-containing protein [Pycnococcus provasolii]